MEYSIPVDDRIREDVRVMCNLSQGILERGEARGETKGEAKGEARIIFSLYKNGYNVEQIAAATDKTAEEIETIIERKEHNQN